MVRVRPLTQPDIPVFIGLIEALADYEHLDPPDAEARARLAADALASPPRFQVLLAEREQEVVGYALYFETYSTFLARPTLYLEDIFVLPEHRHRGAGTALMRAITREAIDRGCGRIEWQVLTWNQPSVRFYQQLGAKPLDDWRGYRLTAQQFHDVDQTS